MAARFNPGAKYWVVKADVKYYTEEKIKEYSQMGHAKAEKLKEKLNKL